MKTDRAAIYAALGAPDFDVRRTALTPTPIDVVTNQAVESVTVTRLEPNQLALDAELTAPGLLVLSEVNYPGWVATVNGVEQPVIEVTGWLAMFDRWHDDRLPCHNPQPDATQTIVSAASPAPAHLAAGPEIATALGSGALTLTGSRSPVSGRYRPAVRITG